MLPIRILVWNQPFHRPCSTRALATVLSTTRKITVERFNNGSFHNDGWMSEQSRGKICAERLERFYCCSTLCIHTMERSKCKAHSSSAKYKAFAGCLWTAAYRITWMDHGPQSLGSCTLRFFFHLALLWSGFSIFELSQRYFLGRTEKIPALPCRSNTRSSTPHFASDADLDWPRAL
jgi:hypothetical protein